MRRKKISEQIDYGGRREKMDPKMLRKLEDPEGLYSQNPAMRKGVKDVQRLVSKGFQEVAQKLSDVTGIEDLTPQQAMLVSQMMTFLQKAMSIESRHQKELEDLAVEVGFDVSEANRDWFQVEAKLGMPSSEGFVSGSKKSEQKPQIDFNSDFDVKNLTDEEEKKLQIHKRNLVNAIIQGSAERGDFAFQDPKVKKKLDAINPELSKYYAGIMAINKFMYFTFEQMIEMMSAQMSGAAGKVQLGDADEDEQEQGVDTKITATGLIFPILLHEVIKGIEEAIARGSLPQDPEMRTNVLKTTDTFENEPMQIRIGPTIVKSIRQALPDYVFDKENRGLIIWFKIALYELPPTDFFDVIGDVISDNPDSISRGKDKMKDILKRAEQLKDEFENYKEEEGIETEKDNLDDINDFLQGMGIEPISDN